MQTGNLYVIAAPSGTGKTSLVKKLTESMPQTTVSISHTTRSKRPAEIHGINYYFISEEEFNRMIKAGEFLEHAKVFNYRYGTSRKWVEDTLAKGTDVILEIDWQGCQQIKKLYPQCISIFILPPSLQALQERLQTRNQDPPEIIQQRLQDAKETVSHVPEYDFLVVNDNFEHALDDLKSILTAGRLVQKRQSQRFGQLIKDFITP